MSNIKIDGDNMGKKNLELENEKLKKENEFLKEKNKELLHNLGLKTIELNEIKRILKLENSKLWDKINNPIITLPSGRQLHAKDLSLEQLEYLESLFDENINRM